MKAGLIRLVVAGMMLTGVCAAVAQQAPAAAPKVKESILKGVLSAPATNAVAGVVALLTHTSGAKDDGKVTVYTLTAIDADVLAKIKDGIAKSATVRLRGEWNKEKTSFAVSVNGYEDETPKHHHQKTDAAAAGK